MQIVPLDRRPLDGAPGVRMAEVLDAGASGTRMSAAEKSGAGSQGSAASDAETQGAGTTTAPVHGQVRVHLAEIDAGASLPRHPAGLDQTFVVLGGTGRVAGADDVQVPVASGDVVRWRTGEQHTSWADTAMRVLIVQHGS